jgi:hypothetical protein
MATSLVANPYTSQHIPHHQSYTYVTAPQPPPSPPVDEASKCSLPSISSLLGGMPNGEQATKQEPQPQGTKTNWKNKNWTNIRKGSPQKSDYRPSSSGQYGPSPSLSTRGALPPTPPMQSDSGFGDGRQSPSTNSNSGYSIASTPNYYFSNSSVSAINNMEPHAQRQHVPALPRRVSMPAQSMPYHQSPFNGSYGGSPMSSYYSSPMTATPPQPQVSGLYYQRPLPQVLSPNTLVLSPFSH